MPCKRALESSVWQVHATLVPCKRALESALQKGFAEHSCTVLHKGSGSTCSTLWKNNYLQALAAQLGQYGTWGFSSQGTQGVVLLSLKLCFCSCLAPATKLWVLQKGLALLGLGKSLYLDVLWVLRKGPVFPWQNGREKSMKCQKTQCRKKASALWDLHCFISLPLACQQLSCI